MLWEPRLRAVDVAQLDVLEDSFWLFFFRPVFFGEEGGVSRQRSNTKMTCGEEIMTIIFTDLP